MICGESVDLPGRLLFLKVLDFFLKTSHSMLHLWETAWWRSSLQTSMFDQSLLARWFQTFLFLQKRRSLGKWSNWGVYFFQLSWFNHQTMDNQQDLYWQTLWNATKDMPGSQMGPCWARGFRERRYLYPRQNSGCVLCIRSLRNWHL